MQNLRRVLLISAIFLEIILRASNIEFLTQLRLIYILTLILIVKGQSNLAVYYILIASMVIELLSLNKLGVMLGAFSLSLLIIKLLAGQISWIGGSKNIQSILVLISALVIERFLLLIYQIQFSHSLLSFLINVILLELMFLLFSNSQDSNNVYKK